MHGGKRPGAGRPKGVKAKRTLKYEAELREAEEKIKKALGNKAFEGDAHTLLMAVYKNQDLPLPIRLDAAKAAIKFEKPALQATTVQHSNQIGDLTDEQLDAFILERARSAAPGIARKEDAARKVSRRNTTH